MAITDVSRTVSRINIEGAYRNGKGAYAVIVFDNSGEAVATITHYMGAVTDRLVPEFAALMAALNYIKSIGSPDYRIAIFGDSAHVMWPFINGEVHLDPAYRSHYLEARRVADTIKNLTFKHISYMINREAHALAAKTLKNHV